MRCCTTTQAVKEREKRWSGIGRICRYVQGRGYNYDGCKRQEQGEPRVTVLIGEVLLKRLDIPLLKKPGKGVRNIEFAALSQMSQICDTTLPIEEQEYPAFPARELICKCLRRCGRNNPKNESCVESSFLHLKFRHYHSLPSIASCMAKKVSKHAASTSSALSQFF